MVEFGDKLFGALYIADGVPFVFFNTTTLPTYEVLNLGKDRGKPPGVHDPTHTRTPEGYVPLPRGKGYIRGTSGTLWLAKRNATTRDGCPNQCLPLTASTPPLKHSVN